MPASTPPDQRARRCPPSPAPVTSAQAAHDKPHRPPGRRTKPLSPAGPPHNDRENAAAASSASTRSSRNAAISRYGRAGGTIAGRGDRDHRDPRPRDREGSPRPGRPQARRPRQRDRDIQDRRLPEATAPTTAMLTSTGVHVAFWLADANHPAHTSAPARTRTNATSNRRTLRSSALRVVHGRLRSVTSRDEPGLIGPASRRTRIPARARHHQSR